MSSNIKILLFCVSIILLYIVYFLSKKSKKQIVFLGYIGIAYSIFYITWRILFTLPQSGLVNIIFGVLLIAFEIVAFGQSVVFKMFFSSTKKISLKKDAVFTALPDIDIVISTYNESEEVLKRTIISCKEIDYPKDKIKIYIGDDGDRQEIKTLADFYGIKYVMRESNAHAKAGNINNVLAHSSGAFILLLDADMIPRQDILKKMIYYFEDLDTGFVQAPQVFYNLDPFQYNLDIGDDIPNEQDFFMRTIQEKRSLYNAVLHVGTNALFRRAALEKIGGIPTGSITEDMATGMLIQNAGYKSYFVGDTLAVGLSVESFEDLIHQRDRWLRGNIQVFKKYNPFKMKGLTSIQKLIYLDGFVYWLFGIQKMVYIISPLLFLLLRVTIFQANTLDLALIFLPYFISTSLYFRAVSKKTRNVTWSHIYDTAIAPQMAVSFLYEFFFHHKLKFNVTPKGVQTFKSKYKIRLALTHIILFGLSLIAIVLNSIFIIQNPGTLLLSSLLINLAWCIYNGLAIFISIFLPLEKKRYRSYERIPVNLRAKVSIRDCDRCDECGYCGRIKNISEDGAFVLLKDCCTYFDFIMGRELSLQIENLGIIKGVITRVVNQDSEYEIGMHFIHVGYNEFSIINQYRFALNNKYVNQYPINKKMDSFLEVVNRIFKKLK